MIAALEAHAAGLWSRDHWWGNSVAGLIVGVVALPLAMAFAIASGARPEQGLYTAIVAGLLCSLFGGTRVQISGPTGAFVAVLSVITAQHGIAGLQIASLMAGLILLGFGLARLGTVMRYVPQPVIAGFTAGIGLIIFVGQWKDFFGLTPAATGAHFHQKFLALLRALPGVHPATLGLALLSLAILLFGGRLLKRIPAPLVAMLVATLLQSTLHFTGVATIGSAFGGLPRTLPLPSLPDISFSAVLGLVGPAFAIALLGAIESLLSAVVADGMTGHRHDSNQELMGQGIANIVAPLFGGFAATGAIARTATSIRNGATGPLAGVVHCAFLLVLILLLAPLAAAVPLCCLAAILFVVAWNMSELPRCLRLLRSAPPYDVAVLVITFALTVFVDLVVAVNVGVILAALLFMRRMAQSVSVELAVARPQAGESERGVPVLVAHIDGPLFFGATESVLHTLTCARRPGMVLVLGLGRVPCIDATGLLAIESLIRDLHNQEASVILAELRPNVRLKLERAGVLALLAQADVVATLDDALERSKGAAPPASASRPIG